MARKLDRSRDFGTIFGGGRERFHQDGLYFDVHGDEIVKESEQGEKKPGPNAPVAAVKGKTVKDEPAPSLLDEQLAAQSEVTG